MNLSGDARELADHLEDFVKKYGSSLSYTVARAMDEINEDLITLTEAAGGVLTYSEQAEDKPKMAAEIKQLKESNARLLAALKRVRATQLIKNYRLEEDINAAITAAEGE